MATFNEILEGGLNQALAKRLGMQTGAPAPSCAPEVMPVAVVMGDRPDHRYWQGDLLWGGGTVIAGNPATFTTAQLRNPLGSGVLAVVDLLVIGNSGGAAGVFGMAITGIASDLAVAGTAGPRDGRQFGREPSLILSTGNTSGAATSSALGTFVIPVAGLSLPVPVILTPGTTLEWGPTAANQPMVSAIYWSERPVVSGEL